MQNSIIQNTIMQNSSIQNVAPITETTNIGIWN
jgi:hypothetical protein